MEKISKSYRFDKTTVDQIDELSSLLKESQKDVIQRAVKALFDDRANVFTRDVEERTARSKKTP